MENGIQYKPEDGDMPIGRTTELERVNEKGTPFGARFNGYDDAPRIDGQLSGHFTVYEVDPDGVRRCLAQFRDEVGATNQLNRLLYAMNTVAGQRDDWQKMWKASTKGEQVLASYNFKLMDSLDLRDAELKEAEQRAEAAEKNERYWKREAERLDAIAVDLQNEKLQATEDTTVLNSMMSAAMPNLTGKYKRLMSQIAVAEGRLGGLQTLGNARRKANDDLLQKRKDLKSSIAALQATKDEMDSKAAGLKHVARNTQCHIMAAQARMGAVRDGIDNIISGLTTEDEF